jgi:cytochrome c biogenesis protein CcmG/thiol:disulfide interchange protein DsbE
MRGRTALVTSLVLGALLVGLVLVLATREPATTRVAKSRLVGKAAPAITGSSVTGGGSFDLADHRGRFVLVNFFATWCTPCIEEHDDLVQFADTHAAAGDASVVSVVYSDTTDDVRRFFEQRGGDWPVVADDDGSVATSYAVIRVPESYLVGPDGRVVLKITGGIKADQLEELYAEAVARYR